MKIMVVTLKLIAAFKKKVSTNCDQCRESEVRMSLLWSGKGGLKGTCISSVWSGLVRKFMEGHQKVMNWQRVTWTKVRHYRRTINM